MIVQINGNKGNINISDSITDIISSYGQYQDGWDFGEGVSASPHTISKAVEIYLLGKEYGFITEPHPIEDGGINLIFYIKDTAHFLDVEITPDGKIDYRYEIGIGRRYTLKEKKKNSNASELIQKFNEIKRNTCDTSESSTLRSTALEKKDFLQELLENTRVEYRFYPKNVQTQNQNPLVNISRSFTVAPLLEVA